MLPEGIEPLGRARLLTASLGTGPAFSPLCHVDWRGEEHGPSVRLCGAVDVPQCPVPVPSRSPFLPPRGGVRIEWDHLINGAQSSAWHRLRAAAMFTTIVPPALSLTGSHAHQLG